MHALYGAQLARYYAHHGVTAHLMVLPGEEGNKRQEAVTEVGTWVGWGVSLDGKGKGGGSPKHQCLDPDGH